MNELYRGHDIVVLDSNPKSAVIFERQTGTPLPTKVTALPDEGEGACLRRARRLIDLYLETPELRRGAALADRGAAFPQSQVGET